MKNIIGGSVFLAIIIWTAAWAADAGQLTRSSEQEFIVLGEDRPQNLFCEAPFYDDWIRPAGPLKVGLQVGHWKNIELPEELKHLRNNSGAAGSGKSEWQVTLAIAEETKDILERYGILVDVLPATVPPAYWADVVVALHADGSLNRQLSGFKVASPWLDRTGHSAELAKIIEQTYAVGTGLAIDSNVTDNMRGYYAFNWRRYQHAIHPMTAAVILETGFLTNHVDRRILIDQPEIPAQALAESLLIFLAIR